MCGIIGAIAERDVTRILIEGLKRLEYRGYDSAGLVVLDDSNQLQRLRATGKVSVLADLLANNPVRGSIGIAHTRWATHGAPADRNAHPHMSAGRVAVVHNGIIENHEVLRERLIKDGFVFESETDTEVIVHLIEQQLRQSVDLVTAIRKTIVELKGAYAIGVVSSLFPEQLIAARKGSPLGIGLGIGEHFIASDVNALLPVTRRFIHLEDGDIAILTRNEIQIQNTQGQRVERRINESSLNSDAVSKGEYRHFMEKEIHEQAEAISSTLEGRLGETRIDPAIFGLKANELLKDVQHVHIVACGTSYHAGMVAKYWIEKLAGLPCQVEVASEYRYRDVVVPKNTLYVTISQSGETADTLAALRFAKTLGYRAQLGLCNVPESSLMREADLNLLTRAGPEIGVASTKAFTTQLTALLLLTCVLADKNPKIHEIIEQLRELPSLINATLAVNKTIEKVAERFVQKNNALFLGRGVMYPIALEGALKLKEISYIHAEAYPAGELKHGPLALVDEEMPIVAIAPAGDLLEKLKSNLQEVRARGGQLFVFVDSESDWKATEGIELTVIPHCGEWIAPIIYTLPLQLLSYHVAVLRGTDVDQPRNLAKSVTVE
ncbi:MAG: glutamine--fructose-6-phosphate transaminase (isomerizing) [Gammaproteobacteria bacterium]|nr:glutamine--fructose-6-phosphate transaminase (isomerizing) [Gammaproteobacteria bacterium]